MTWSKEKKKPDGDSQSSREDSGPNSCRTFQGDERMERRFIYIAICVLLCMPSLQTWLIGAWGMCAHCLVFSGPRVVGPLTQPGNQNTSKSHQTSPYLNAAQESGLLLLLHWSVHPVLRRKPNSVSALRVFWSPQTPTGRIGISCGRSRGADAFLGQSPSLPVSANTPLKPKQCGPALRFTFSSTMRCTIEYSRSLRLV